MFQTEERLRIAVIVGSTREGRAGGDLSHWFAERARKRDDVEAAVVDLVDFEFPRRYPDEATPPMAAFGAALDRADAFVVVTPEYNRSFPASLKQAIDYAFDEWHAKPVGFVSYGCGSAGIYAVEQLRVVFTELHTVTMRNSVSFDLLETDIDDSGQPTVTDRLELAVTTMLDQLVWWGHALRDARAIHPYVS